MSLYTKKEAVALLVARLKEKGINLGINPEYVLDPIFISILAKNNDTLGLTEYESIGLVENYVVDILLNSWTIADFEPYLH